MTTGRVWLNPRPDLPRPPFQPRPRLQSRWEGTVEPANDAKILRFCCSKCHTNFEMKNPCRVKWTKAYRRLHGKDMTQDLTFEFDRKHNGPERYDRNVTEYSEVYQENR